MIGHLVRAQLWRARWTFLHVAAMGALGVVSSSPTSQRMMLAMPLIMAVGLLTTLGLFWSREVRILPIRPKAALRSVWCVVMLFPASILLGRLAVVFGFAIGGSSAPLTAEAIGIMAAFDAVYVGTSLLLLQQEGEPWYGFLSLRSLFGSLWMAVYLPFMVLPFAWPELVPRALSGVTFVHVAIALAGLAATLWPIIVTPNRWPSLGVIHDVRRPGAAVQLPPKRTERWLDRLHGISRLLPGPVLGATIVALLSLATFVVVSIRFRGGIRSPFDAAMGEMEFLFLGGPIVMLVLGPMGLSALTPFLRRLKVMPIGGRRLILILTCLPLITPLMYWMFAAAFHAIVGSSGSPAWRPGTLLFLGGVLALGSAFTTRFNSAAARMWQVFPFVGLIALIEILGKDQIEPVFAVLLPGVGATALAAALFLNHHTLTYASSQAPVYRSLAAAR